jgi:hypothetical protein
LVLLTDNQEIIYALDPSDVGKDTAPITNVITGTSWSGPIQLAKELAKRKH